VALACASASSLGLLFVTCLVLALAGVGPQQVVFGLAFAVYAAVAARVTWFREATGWLTVGRVDRGIMAAAAGIAAVSAAMLLVWYATARPDLADLVRTFIPDWPTAALVPAALAFSLVNAVVEEAAYRGVVLGALERTRIAIPVAVALQATAFSALHLQAGFPRGVPGVAMTFVYGLALGALRRHAAGLLAPFVAHVLTDLVIVTIVLTLVGR
jgi:uncharacterized protein